VTEEEAKTKRCCGGQDCGHYNENPYPARWCIGSACMAWRQRNIMGDEPNSSGGLISAGYCGLAGRTP